MPPSYDSSKICKGCRVAICNTPVFYYKKYIEFICPCSLCLVKVMCNAYCEQYYNYEDEYKKRNIKEGTKMASGKQLKLLNVNSV